MNNVSFCRLCALEIQEENLMLLDEIKFKILFPKLAILKHGMTYSCQPCTQIFNSFYEFHAVVVDAEEKLKIIQKEYLL